MRKYVIPIILALLIGFLLAKFMINQYEKKEKLSTVFSGSETIYFIQQGVYSSVEEMEKNVSNFTYYVYTADSGKYYVYIGMTKSVENSEKLKGFFEEKGYSTYIKEFKLSNRSFLEVLEQYDKLLSSISDESTIQAICSQVLSKYEELVLDGGND